MVERGTRAVSPASGVCWCVDRQVTWVFAGSRMVMLTGFEQAIWSWMTLSYSLETVAELLEELLPANPAGARQRAEQTVELWLAQGILAEAES